jgi:hypothetical protein
MCINILLSSNSFKNNEKLRKFKNTFGNRRQVCIGQGKLQTRYKEPVRCIHYNKDDLLNSTLSGLLVMISRFKHLKF